MEKYSAFVAIFSGVAAYLNFILLFIIDKLGNSMNMKNLLLWILYYLHVITLTAILIFFLYVKINFDRETIGSSSIKFCLSEIGQCKSAVTMYDVVYFKKSDVPVCALKDSPSTSTCYPDAAYQTCIYGLTLTESTLESLFPNTSHAYIPLFWPILILSFVSIVASLIFEKEFVDMSTLRYYCFLCEKRYFLVFSRVISGAVAALLIISAKIFTVVFSEDCSSTTSDYCTQISACKSEIKSILVTDDVAIVKYNVILVSFIGFLILGIMISSWESILQAIVFEDIDDGRTRSLFSRALETTARDIMTRNWNLEVKMNDDNLECPICLGIMKMSTTIRKQLSHSESTVPIDNELSVKPSSASKSPRLAFHHGNVVPFSRSLTSDSGTQFAPMTLLHKPGFIGRIVEVEEKSTELSFEEQEVDLNNDYIVDFRQATSSSSCSGFPITSTLSYDQERQFFMKRKNSFPYNNSNSNTGYSGNNNNQVMRYLERDMSMESFHWSPNSSRSMDDRAGGAGADIYSSYDFIDTCRVMMKRDTRKESGIYSRSQFRISQQSIDSPSQLLSSLTTTTSTSGGQQLLPPPQVLGVSHYQDGDDIESTNHEHDIHHNNISPFPSTSSIDDSYSHYSSPFSSKQKGGASERYYLRKKTFESLQSFDSTSQASHQFRRHPLTVNMNTSTSFATARSAAVSRLVLESKESAVSSASSCCSTVSHPVVVTRRFHAMRPTGFALSASKKFRSPKLDSKPPERHTVIRELESGSETASEVAAGGAVRDAKASLSDLYDEQGAVFEIIRRPHFDLSRKYTEEEEGGWEEITPLPVTAPAPTSVREESAPPAPSSEEVKGSEAMAMAMATPGRRVSFHILNDCANTNGTATANHPPYLDKISPLSSGSEEFFKQDNTSGQGSASDTYAAGGVVVRPPRRSRYRQYGGGGEAKGGGTLFSIASGKDKYAPPSPLVRYASKSSDMITYDEESQQQQQQSLRHEKEEEKEYKNNDNGEDKSVTRTRSVYQQSSPQRDEEDNRSSSSNNQLGPTPLDSQGSIQSSSHAFPSGSTSSVLSSKVSIITIAAQELLAQVPCGHIFHKECILEWANQNTTCPVCRKDLTSGLVIGENDATATAATRPPFGFGRLGNALIDE